MRVSWRHLMLSSLACCLSSSPSFATDTPKSSQARPPVEETHPFLLDDPITLSFRDLHRENWVDSVTMTRLPPGSLIVRYDGFHGLVMKHLRGQGRQLIKRATDRGWYVQPDNESRTLYWSATERDWVGTDINGAWWTRSWLDSREPEDGGAPAAAYSHTYGQEISWRRGPFELTNTLKFKFDYLGLFELNPDPVEPQGQVRRSPLSIDVKTNSAIEVGTGVVFKVRPRLRVGIPKDGLESVLKGASVEVSFELIHWSKAIIKGDVQFQWKGRDDLSVTFDMTLASW